MHKAYRKTLLALSLAACTFLAGCETMPTSLGGSGSSQSSGDIDPRLKQNNPSFFNKSSMQACGVGAATGAVGCLLAGKGADCVAIAAVTGCGIGIGTNKYLENQKTKYANQEQRINAAIADVQKDNREIQAMNNTSIQVINDNKRTLAQLKKDLASKKIDQASARKQLALIDRNTANLREKQAAAKKRLSEYQSYSTAERNSGANTKQLDGSIASMRKEVNTLEKQIDQLYAQRSAIKVG